MEIRDAKEIISANVNELQLYEYLTANFGEIAGIYADGSFQVGESVGREMLDNERPIAIAKCPGLANLDSDFFTRDWTELDPETGAYVVTSSSDGCDVGDRLSLAQCIYICCADGDVTDYVDELREKLIDNFIASEAAND